MSSNNSWTARALITVYAHVFLLNFDKDDKIQIFQITPKIGGCEELQMETKNEIQAMGAQLLTLLFDSSANHCPRPQKVELVRILQAIKTVYS